MSVKYHCLTFKVELLLIPLSFNLLCDDFSWFCDSFGYHRDDNNGAHTTVGVLFWNLASHIKTLNQCLAVKTVYSEKHLKRILSTKSCSHYKTHSDLTDTVEFISNQMGIFTYIDGCRLNANVTSNNVWSHFLSLSLILSLSLCKDETNLYVLLLNLSVKLNETTKLRHQGENPPMSA